jgi:mevalonate kinase
MQQFRSNGKLLLTAEYLVLDGAKALAVPTKLGQSLDVRETELNKPQVQWKALDHNGNVWLDVSLNDGLFSAEALGSEAQMLIPALQHIAKQRPDLLWKSDSTHFHLTSKLEFPRNWGLGSSSTFINNIAQWAQIDALELHFAISNGSGYDAAAASTDHPIVYQINDKKPIVEQAAFNPPFAEQLHFVHLNQKQQSSQAIANYKARRDQIDVPANVKEVSAYADAFCNCKDIKNFERLLNSHEQLLARVLDIHTVKSRLFPGYPFAIKSLGAWGGDFVLVVGAAEDMNYFRSKGFETIIPYNDMVINSSHQ